MKERLQHILTHKLFRYALLGLTVLFVIGSIFITFNPKGFIQYGYLGVFFFNIISSGLMLLPTLVKPLSLPLVILASATGNCVNTSINYLVGTSGKSFFLHIPWVQKIKKLMRKFETEVIFILAVLPLPLDINGLLSGYLGVSYKKYIFLNFLGKMTIFTLVGLGIITLTRGNR